MLLSLQAYERAQTPQARSALIEAAEQPLDDLLVEAARSGRVAFSPDGQTLAVGDSGGHVGLWDTATGRRTATLAEGSAVYSVAFSPDGQMLAAGDRRRCRPVGLAPGGGPPPWPKAAVSDSVAFSPDGQTLAAGDDGGHVGLWDRHRAADRHPGRGQPCLQCGVQPGRPDPRRRRRRRPCRPVGRGSGPADRHPGRRQPRLQRGVQPDGRTLAVGDDGGHVGLWDRHRPADRHPGRRQPCRSVAFSPTARPSRPATTAAMSACGTRQRPADRHPGRRQPRLQRGVQPGRPDPRGRRRRRRYRPVGPGNRQRTVHPGRRQPCLQRGVQSRRPDARGRRRGGDVGLWDRHRAADRHPGRRQHCRQVAFSPDGQTLAVGDYGGDVGLWDAAPGGGPPPWPSAAWSQVWRSARTGRHSPSATSAAMSACGTWHRAADRHPGRGQPVVQCRVQPGRPDTRRRRLRRPCRPVGRSDRAADRHPGRRQVLSSVSPSVPTGAPWPPATSAVTSACGTWRPDIGPPPSSRAAPSSVSRSALTVPLLPGTRWGTLASECR